MFLLEGKNAVIYFLKEHIYDQWRKNKIYTKYLKYAFNEYYKIQKQDTFKLYQYTKKFNIEKEIYGYFEVLLWLNQTN